MNARPLALALDLGSTRIKIGTLDATGELVDIRSTDAPALRGDAPIREGDALAYVDAARRLVDGAARTLPQGIPLGVATQRSSFVIWNAQDGLPRTPLVSWQDRRAARWCDAHRELEPEIRRRTGLALSAHYAAPKLATMQQNNSELRQALHHPAGRFGTLETYLLWHSTDARLSQTDLSVAARTLLVDLDRESWDDALLEQFDVPRTALATIAPGLRPALALDLGPMLRATLSDQASGALTVIDSQDTAIVNLGTGAFVLCSAPGATRRPGYSTAPTLGGEAATRYAIEGTINGSGPAAALYGASPTDLPAQDPAPEAFAIPDMAGLGSPWWRPEIGLTLSSAAQALDPADRRRVIVEGLAFRVRGILEDLSANGSRRVLVGGGLSRDPGVVAALAGALGRPVEALLEPEITLRGVGRLAAGLEPFAEPRSRLVGPGPGWLEAKYPRWRSWVGRILEGTPGGCRGSAGP